MSRIYNFLKTGFHTSPSCMSLHISHDLVQDELVGGFLSGIWMHSILNFPFFVINGILSWDKQIHG